MFCPGCGTDASADQQFCRCCGLGLQPFSKVLEKPDKNSEQRRRNEVRRAIQIVAWVLFIVAAVLSGVVPRGGGFAVLVAMIGAGLMGYSIGIQVGPGSRKPSKPKALQASETGRVLHDRSSPEPVPSVTEHTTEFITPRKRIDITQDGM